MEKMGGKRKKKGEKTPWKINLKKWEKMGENREKNWKK